MPSQSLGNAARGRRVLTLLCQSSATIIQYNSIKVKEESILHVKFTSVSFAYCTNLLPSLASRKMALAQSCQMRTLRASAGASKVQKTSNGMRLQRTGEFVVHSPIFSIPPPQNIVKLIFPFSCSLPCRTSFSAFSPY